MKKEQNFAKIMTTICVKFQNSLYILLGFILIVLIFYNRILRERLPKDLYIFFFEISSINNMIF